MNTKRIRELAEQAGIDEWWDSGNECREVLQEYLEKLAELIAADERNRIWTQSHWTEYERKIVAAERKACAKVCESLEIPHPDTIEGSQPDYVDGKRMAAMQCAAAIRARGK